MIPFRNLSIRKKLIFISMLTSGAALFFASIAFIGSEYFALRSSMRENLSSLARVIGTNCVASLTFDDADAAGETLSALGAEPQIVLARIYTADGRVFAEYSQRGSRGKPLHESGGSPFLKNRTASSLAAGLGENHVFREGRLYVFEPIVLDQKVVGLVEVASDLGAFYLRMRSVILICSIILALAFLMAYMITRRVQRTISDPISTLTRTMNEVSWKKDYSVRVKKQSTDELGVLFDGFNAMLSEIQTRDERLHFTQFSVDHMGDAAFRLDAEGRVVYVNHAAAGFLGYSREELLGMGIWGFDPNFPETRWPEHWEEVRRRKAFAFESSHMKKNGKIFPVEIYVNYLEFEGREYNCAFARDITERKQLQLQLEQAEKIEAIGTLAGGVAHDLNNILGGLVGYPELLLLDLPEDSPMRHPLMAVKQSGEKAAAIVQDMLTLARRGVEIRTAVNLNETVTEYFRTPEFDRIRGLHPNVRFQIHMEEGLPNILGSSLHLSKVLMNLVSNAVESMNEGGNADISTSSRYLDGPHKGYQTIPEGTFAVLSVEDQGCGIGREDIQHIFEPFYTKKVMGRSGTGLGMTVVSGTVKDHKGFIDLKSVEGRGTRFDLYFPITHHALQEKEDTASLESCRGTEKILVVDDIEEQREIAGLVLKKLGYRVVVVAGGEEAVAYVKENRVDLVVLDMIMEPGIDGLETFRRISALFPGQKAIIASGFAETERVKEALRLGVGAYVKKPYTIGNLGMAIRQELDRR